MSLPTAGTKAVINTGPLIACALATGDWSILITCGLSIAIPTAVIKEIQTGPSGSPGRDIPLPEAIAILPEEPIPRHLTGTLDTGEASVIAAALNQQTPLVIIDELAGRRVARLHGLHVTGSLGLLVCACRKQPDLDFEACTAAMIRGGIYLSTTVLNQARLLLP